MSTNNTSQKTRPDDREIVEALTQAFRVHELTIVGWLCDMDLKQVEIQISEEEGFISGKRNRF